jgi:hypothetical protein
MIAFAQYGDSMLLGEQNFLDSIAWETGLNN